MHRTGSSSRVAAKGYLSDGSSAETSGIEHVLLKYDPGCDYCKKQKTRVEFAKSAIHSIPLLVFLSAVILWYFSTTGGKANDSNPSILLSD